MARAPPQPQLVARLDRVRTESVRSASEKRAPNVATEPRRLSLTKSASNARTACPLRARVADATPPPVTRARARPCRATGARPRGRRCHGTPGRLRDARPPPRAGAFVALAKRATRAAHSSCRGFRRPSTNTATAASDTASVARTGEGAQPRPRQVRASRIPPMRFGNGASVGSLLRPASRATITRGDDGRRRSIGGQSLARWEARTALEHDERGGAAEVTRSEQD